MRHATLALSDDIRTARNVPMIAIVKKNNAIYLEKRLRPEIKNANDVLIKVALAALCRTDLYVARGLIGTQDPLILGHEFSGIVESTGKEACHLKTGTRVGIMPVFEENGETITLGKDIDGAFAEYVVVPSTRVFALPDTISFEEGAYLEPIAASLAVMKAPIAPPMKGLLYGDNRISVLTQRILQLNGFGQVDILSSRERAPTGELYDFVIETAASEEAFDPIMNIIKPGGILILKSRFFKPVMLSVSKIVQKELRLYGAYYGNFQEAIDLLVSGKLQIKDLLGKIFSFEDAVKILSGKMLVPEDKKIFFRP